MQKFTLIKFFLSFLILSCFLFFVFYFFPAKTLASFNEGVIDDVSKYAWGDKIGWVNFGCQNCNVRVTDSQITGYVFSSNYGWINLNPTNGGIQNDGEGNLSGYAWAESLGWINWDSVSINENGKFVGSASFSTFGTINFDCPTCKVITDWRAKSLRSICNNAIDDDNDGRIDFPNDSGCSSREDNDEFNESVVFLTNWFLKPVLPETEEIKDEKGEDISILKPEIFEPELKVDQKEVAKKEEKKSKPIINWPEIKEKTEEVIAKVFNPIPIQFFIPDFKKESKIVTPQVSLEKIAKEKPILILEKKWILLPRKPICEFVLAPLPKDIKRLAEKFPELNKTFNEIGVKKITDLGKLRSVSLNLPGISERVIYGKKITSGNFAEMKGVPIAKLSPQMKQSLPSEIVFAKTGGGLVDFNIVLSIDEEGKAKQTIHTIAGRPIELSIKPEAPVKNVYGYIVLKSLSMDDTLINQKEVGFLELPAESLMASVFFAKPVLAKEVKQKVVVEEKFVLSSFKYEDFDGDGIYTATVNAPLVDGEYEVITVLEFMDPDFGLKEIRLITVVDPEGYIYVSLPEGELRIANATITLWWRNLDNKEYVIWPAHEYSQDNPQITDDTGKYSFLVPPGFYYIKVEHPKYPIYQSEEFKVEQGSGIHKNIELKSKDWWKTVFDWKNIIIFVLAVLLFYNFYHDRMIEKIIKNRLNR